MERPRFELEWLMPWEPGLTTHVTLFDGEFPPHYVLAVGHGADEAETLLDLWTTLVDRNEPAQAIAFVAAVFRKRTGHEPSDRPGEREAHAPTAWKAAMIENGGGD